jgi:hypothetical protein
MVAQQAPAVAQPSLNVSVTLAPAAVRALARSVTRAPPGR